MRIIIVLILAMFILPSVSSSQAEPRDALEVSIYSFDDTALISWSPAPGAIGYHVFRGPSLETVTPIGTSTTTLFYDETAPMEEVWYVIYSVHPEGGFVELLGESRGHCLKLKGSTGFSLTMAHCLPTRPI